jgi:hypothetical protein
MNGKWSTTTLLITGIVGLVLGYLVMARLFPIPAPSHAGGTVKAVINLKSADKSCQQYAGSDFGHVVKYAFPVLSRSAKQTIVWHGQVDGGPPNQKVEVEFPGGQSPFSKDKFDEDQDSGPPVTDNYGDYPFSKVWVGGTECSSFSDPGTHIDH